MSKGTRGSSPVSQTYGRLELPVFTPDPIPSSGPIPSLRRNAVFLVQILGLVATGYVIWSTSISPRLFRQSVEVVIDEALRHALQACLVSVAVTLILYLLASRSLHTDAIATAVRTSATAVWFAPATILLAILSPLALGAALVLIVSATRLLYSEWVRVESTDPEAEIKTEMLDVLQPPFRFRELIPGLTTSLALQCGVLTAVLGYPLTAAGLFCLFAAMLTLLSLIAGWTNVRTQTSLPRSVFGMLLTIILAAGLTVGGLTGQFNRDSWRRATFAPGSRPGMLQSARELLKKLSPPEPPVGPPEVYVRIKSQPEGTVDIADNGFPGVILWPEIKPEITLVAPLPSWVQHAGTPVSVRPFSIVFSGQYWMFRPPDSRPPARSFFRRASPLALSFVTTDHKTLAMEAAQKLEHSIDLRCCSSIDIEFSNADRYIGTIALEIILVNTSGHRAQSESLGMVRVTSRPTPVRRTNPSESTRETLHFPIPSQSALREFDEIEVIFHRDSVRADRSAKLSIERFILVPR